MSALVTLVWVGLATRSPTLTYHLAPAVAAFAWAGYLLLRGEGPPVPVRTALAACFALLVTATATVLAATGALQGPTLVHRGNALAESVLAALFGAVLGWVMLAWAGRTRA